MANYKETSTTATSRQRANVVHIRNELNQAPVVTFLEETVIESAAFDTIHKSAGQLVVEFDPTKVITIIDPVTDLPIGKTLTMAEIQAAIYSLYSAEAQVRDALLAPQPETTSEPTPIPTP